jgi:Family of unknown function (DUF5947)
VSTPDRTQAEVVSALRRLQMRQMPEGPQPIEANCDLCGTSMPEDHRHLLQLEERSIVCVCESCWALRSGDAEYRPTGSRVVWLDDLVLPDELWARFRIPIGLAFFLRTGSAQAPGSAGRAATGSGVVAFYPSPAGATESELDLGVWDELVRLNPVLEDLGPEGETLIVDRMSRAGLRCAIAPTDQAYRLVGLVKASWQGISGGPEVGRAVDRFFDDLRERAAR